MFKQINTRSSKIALSSILLFSIIMIPFLLFDASAQGVPEWIKNTALWYGEGEISEMEFLNAIKFLIEQKIIVIDADSKIISPQIVDIVIPNGNAEMGNVGFYSPLNALISKGTTIIWTNYDESIHTIQSQDDDGNPTGLFSSSLLNTGESYEYTFDEDGSYNYYCTFHPWRVGVVTVQ